MFFSSYLHLVSALIYFFISGVYFFREKKQLVFRMGGIMFVFIGSWSFTLFLLALPNLPIEAVKIIIHISAIANLNMASFILFTVLVYTEKYKIYRSRYFKSAILLAFLIHAIFQLSNQLTIPGEFNLKYNYWKISWNESWRAIPVFIYYYACIFVSILYLFYFSLKTKNPLKKKQTKVILISSVLAVLIVFVNLYISKLNNSDFPGIYDSVSLFVVMGILYAIKKYNFFEITPSSAAERIIETMPDGLIITDIEGNIKITNTSLSKISGFSQIELIGLNINKLLSNEFNNKKILTYYSKRHLDNQEATLFTKNEDEIPVLFSSSILLDELNNPQGIICIIHDITVRKKYERSLEAFQKDLEIKIFERTLELQESNLDLRQKIEELEKLTKALEESKIKAEESDKLKSAFLANISHEIRTPMSAILGFTEILRKEDISEAERNSYFKIISNNGKQLLHILSSIIEISIIETGQVHLNVSKFNLNALMDELYTLVKLTIDRQKKQINLFYNKLEEFNYTLIHSDQERLKLIMLNLLNNAIQYTESGAVSYGYSIETSGDKLKFFIKDTGIGISEEKQSWLFQRFMQFADSQLREHGGSGLGLAISKGLINLLGGEIWVESKTGVGSVFYFTIPYK